MYSTLYVFFARIFEPKKNRVLHKVLQKTYSFTFTALTKTQQDQARDLVRLSKIDLIQDQARLGKIKQD